MRKLVILAATVSLAACSGGGGGTVAPALQAPSGPTAPQSAYVTPTFSIVTAPSTTQGIARNPKFVSSGTNTVTIALTSPVVPGLTPTSVTSTITPPCTAAAPCVVSGPPSPPGQADTFLVTTYTNSPVTGPAPAQLGTATVTFTPAVGVANSVPITILGIPSTVSFALANGTAGTALTPTTITPSVLDASGQTIAGTYASPITITSSDTKTSGLLLSGGSPATTCTTGPCTVTIAAAGQTFTENYGGLAEATQQVAYSGGPGLTAGSSPFAVTLAPITHVSGPTSALGGAGSPFVGVDLYALTGTGSTGAETYSEAGYTGTYGNTLAATNAAGCTFASIATTKDGSNNTVFTATETGATPAAGVCTYTVGDGGLHSGAALPTFVTTFTTSGIGASSSSRHQ